MTEKKYVTEEFFQFAIDQFTEVVKTHHDGDIARLEQEIEHLKEAFDSQSKFNEKVTKLFESLMVI